MATVYRADMRGMGGFSKIVALKIVHPHLGVQPEFVQMFNNEALLGGYLSHPNIVETLDFGEQDGRLFLAMEYMNGPSLQQLLFRQERYSFEIPPEIAIKLIIQVCHGLAYAHEALDREGRPLKMVHRDLKPSNILLSLHGSAKIADFGVARAESNLVHTQATGALKGTVRYMSPEQAWGRRDLDFRSDVFAVGAMLFELLTLRPLYEGERMELLLREAQDCNVESRLSFLPDCAERGAIEAVLERCLAADRDRRIASCGRLAADLEGILAASSHRLELRTWMNDVSRHWTQVGTGPIFPTPTPAKAPGTLSLEPSVASSGSRKLPLSEPPSPNSLSPGDSFKLDRREPDRDPTENSVSVRPAQHASPVAPPGYAPPEPVHRALVTVRGDDDEDEFEPDGGKTLAISAFANQDEIYTLDPASSSHQQWDAVKGAIDGSKRYSGLGKNKLEPGAAPTRVNDAVSRLRAGPSALDTIPPDKVPASSGLNSDRSEVPSVALGLTTDDPSESQIEASRDLEEREEEARPSWVKMAVLAVAVLFVSFGATWYAMQDHSAPRTAPTKPPKPATSSASLPEKKSVVPPGDTGGVKLDQGSTAVSPPKESASLEAPPLARSGTATVERSSSPAPIVPELAKPGTDAVTPGREKARAAKKGASEAADEAHQGIVFLNSRPESTITLDGQTLAEFPVLNRSLSVGEHTVKFVAEGQVPLERRFTVVESGIIRCTAYFQKSEIQCR